MRQRNPVARGLDAGWPLCHSTQKRRTVSTEISTGKAQKAAAMALRPICVEVAEHETKSSHIYLQYFLFGLCLLTDMKVLSVLSSSTSNQLCIVLQHMDKPYLSGPMNRLCNAIALLYKFNKFHFTDLIYSVLCCCSGRVRILNLGIPKSTKKPNAQQHRFQIQFIVVFTVNSQK